MIQEVNFAIVENGSVTNIVVWGGDVSNWSSPAGATIIEITGANVDQHVIGQPPP